ncbi:MAG: IS481 family transposase [Gemmatimonadales bacterium]
MNVHKLAKTTPLGRQAMIGRLESGEGAAAVAASLGLSRTAVYRWWRRYRAEGVAGLQDRSSRPRRSPRRLPRARRRQIVRARRQGQSSLQIAAALGLPVSTVVVTQRRAGWARLPRPPRPPVVRYERARPGELLHVDTKKLGRIGRIGHRIHGDRRTRVRGIGWEVLHVAIDDATRVAYAELLADETAAACEAFLTRAVAWLAGQGIVVERVMTDNGSGYVATRFRRLLERLTLRHLRTRPYTPRTNGKAERFIQTLLREWAYRRPYRSSRWRRAALAPYLRYYNAQRGHTALGFHPPLARLAALQ